MASSTSKKIKKQNSSHNPQKNTLTKSAGIKKQKRPDPKPKKTSIDPAKYFWYDSPGSVTRMVTFPDSSEAPEQHNCYIFNKALFAFEPYPSNFAPGAVWPPQTVEDLLFAQGVEGSWCVRNKPFAKTLCDKGDCTHSLANWQKSTDDWADAFELRETPNRGFGVFTKRAFVDDDVLGWHSGEIKPFNDKDEGKASYGPRYYGPESETMCFCGEKGCVSDETRKEIEKSNKKAEKAKSRE